VADAARKAVPAIAGVQTVIASDAIKRVIACATIQRIRNVIADDVVVTNAAKDVFNAG
jgi:hypothetical protein